MLQRVAMTLLGIVLLIFTGTVQETRLQPEDLAVHSRNGLWIGHQWYTGRKVGSGVPVPEAERRALVQRLREHQIRYAYVHVGPLLVDGSIHDHAGPEFRALRREAPEVMFLPWIGTNVRRLDLGSAAWRRAFLVTVERLQSEGFRGVHLDFEPLCDPSPGYLALLRDLRRAFGPDFFLSHATRRAGPFGFARGPLRNWFWSEDFYRKTMELTDQTVLMAYDTTLDSPRMYRAFVRHETRLLLDWGCEAAGHHVMIGIPAYEDAPGLSNPAVENIPNAAGSVRAVLERAPEMPSCFDGVAIYADWVTDAREWRQLRENWLGI
jgi:hypothetical protein